MNKVDWQKKVDWWRKLIIEESCLTKKVDGQRKLINEESWLFFIMVPTDRQH